jgi:hypothetical protein
MVKYIEHRLTVAGASGGIELMPGAIEAIYQFSQGVPRLINLACDRALLSAYVAGSPQITKAMVQDGQRSLTGEMASALPAKSRHLKTALTILSLSLLFGALFAGLLQRGSLGLEGWWSTLTDRLPLPSVSSGPKTAGRGQTKGLSLPSFSPDAAFPYTIQAVTSPDGEAVRKIVHALQQEGFEVFASTDSAEKGVAHRILVGRFKNPEEAQAAVERVKRVGGFQGAEVIQAAPPPSRGES